MTAAFILIYLLAQLGVCYWVSKKIATESDYFVAGKNLGPGLISFSLFATWFGAETCIGSSGAVYAEGLSGSRADPFGYSVCLFLMGLLMATRLWKGGYTTLADHYRVRYGKLVEQIAIWLLIPSSLIWAAAQLRAFGQVISVTTELPVEVTVLFAFGFVLSYTLLGGLLGDIVTDLIQGIVIIVGLVLLVASVFANGQPVEWISSIDPARLSFVAPGESWLQRLDTWAVPILGSLVAQELISRVLASRSAQVARGASFLACGIYLLLGGIPVLLGLIGPHLVQGIEDREQFLITLARNALHPFVFVVFAGALISAILATIDSILLASAAMISHNVIVPRLRDHSEKRKVLIGRVLVAVSGAVALVIALFSGSIYELVETASAFGTAGVLVITLIGLLSPWGSQVGATSALIVGFLATPIAEYGFEAEAPFLTSILSALVAFAVAEGAAVVYRRWKEVRSLRRETAGAFQRLPDLG